MKYKKTIIALATMAIILITLYPLIEDAPQLLEAKTNPQFYRFYKTIGYSMYPTIHNNSIVLVQLKDHPQFTLEIGDIAVYYDYMHDILVSHRIIKIINTTKTTAYWFLGDNDEQIDTPVPEEYIVGKVILIITNQIEKTILKNIFPQIPE